MFHSSQFTKKNHSSFPFQEIRPTMSQRWFESPSLTAYTQIMAECWSANPAARPTALRVKKSLHGLLMKEVMAEDEIKRLHQV